MQIVKISYLFNLIVILSAFQATFKQKKSLAKII